eukprot:TRINITY_DN62061_c0_g1_i1.p1 TRINITY_DN62061_c0_g1~~TRINITY_DN62061_c0_g1_i1.p1  ORF type:complete len:435 (-),score=99.61 TRINITY_DN62061_c0_g1_i1:72-1274(-)
MAMAMARTKCLRLLHPSLRCPASTTLPLVRTGSLCRHVAGVVRVAAHETKDGGIARFDAMGASIPRLEDALNHFRELNDGLIAEAATSTKGGEDIEATRSKVVESVLKGEKDLFAVEGEMRSAYEAVNSVEEKIASLRYEQLKNSREIGNLKRARVRRLKRNEVQDLITRVDTAFENGGPDALADGPLAAQIKEAAKEIEAQFDDYAKGVSETERAITNMNARLRSAELSLRVRLGDKSYADAIGLRAVVVSTLYEARRKSFRLTALRDMEALAAQELAMLERAREKLELNSKVVKLLSDGDKEAMRSEVKALTQEVVKLQEQCDSLDEKIDEHAALGNSVVQPLRELKDVVSPESVEIRENLIAHLREEIFSLERKRVRRDRQELCLQLMMKLTDAIGR